MKNKNTISSLIHQIARFENQFINEKIREIDLNPDQAQALDFIHQHPGTNQQQIAQLLGRGAASISNLIKGLEKRHLVGKQPNAHNDREKQLFLTTYGETAAAQISQAFKLLNQQFEAALDNPDQLLNDLTNLYDRLQQTTKES
ncbi:transcriptional regulator, MarR family [Lentilactobacillus rapi DSM 19907 = JCM 15042]|uniref:Transcriptional regulator n=2 Tax=Lentilactobacillus rapi TaxID=481723 RepID=A0A512PQB9_9LACO|nr:MarR family winged helix-turn-helix transcriptional regulator [Lentilactobacillus rapi]KRL16773.1 transcriptional regulator, MarR family [Lentilactobacillus rapi DSM 19907 = JCM 15042]GEP73415.1 transcriptional regulator [Lentilactobacillus rapi]